jgi:hypothetical protein
MWRNVHTGRDGEHDGDDECHRRVRHAHTACSYNYHCKINDRISRKTMALYFNNKKKSFFFKCCNYAIQENLLFIYPEEGSDF